MRTRKRIRSDRWSARPVLSAVVRGLIAAVPILAAVAAAFAVSALLPRPAAGVEAVLWWCAVLVASMVTLVVVDALARRLLPLAALLQLSLLFPDQAPSRLRVARRAGSIGGLQRELLRARELPEAAPPADAAEIIISLVTALSVHDRRTRGHSERVHLYADLLGEEMGLSIGDRERLRWAAMLHDIGKLDVEASLLNKSGQPDEDEWAQLREHPETGRQLIRPLVPWLGEWADAVAQHHERFDGTGYPHGLAGHEISRSARIVSVADAYEVMTAPRAYKRPLGIEGARRELMACAGTQFDPEVVRAFYNVSIGRLRRFAWPAALAGALSIAGRPAMATSGMVSTSATATASIVAVGALLAGLGSGGGSGALASDPPEVAAVAPEDVWEEAAEQASALPEAARVADSWLRWGSSQRVASQGAPETASSDGGPGGAPAAVEGAAAGGAAEQEDATTGGPSEEIAPDRASVPRQERRASSEPRQPRTEQPEATGGSDEADPAPPAGRSTSDATAGAPADEPATVGGDRDEAEGEDGNGRNAPRAADDHARTRAGTSVLINVLRNDEGLGRGIRALTVIVDPEEGNAVVRRHHIRYTPPRGHVGTDRFRYQVCVRDGGCGTAWVTVDVTRN